MIFTIAMAGKRDKVVIAQKKLYHNKKVAKKSKNETSNKGLQENNIFHALNILL